MKPLHQHGGPAGRLSARCGRRPVVLVAARQVHERPLSTSNSKAQGQEKLQALERMLPATPRVLAAGGNGGGGGRLREHGAVVPADRLAVDRQAASQLPCGKMVCSDNNRPTIADAVAAAAAAAAHGVQHPDGDGHGSGEHQLTPSSSGRQEDAPALGGRASVVLAAMDASLSRLNITPRVRSLIMLNILVLLVATNWVVLKDAGNHFDPFAFAFLRFFVAAAAFSPFMKAASDDNRILRAGAELGLWTALGYILQSLGLMTTDASRASFLSTFTVLVVPFLAGVSGRGISPITWFSALAALFGVSLLEQTGGAPGIGDIWSLLSALAFGVQVFRVEHWARVLGNKATLPLMSVVLTTTMGLSLVAAAVANPQAVLNIIEHPILAEGWLFDGRVPWKQVLYTGLITTDVALLMELVALRNVSSTEAAIVYTLEPVLGAFFAYLLLGERWGPSGWIGAALIVSSSVLTQVYGSEADSPVVPLPSEVAVPAERLDQQQRNKKQE